MHEMHATTGATSVPKLLMLIPLILLLAPWSGMMWRCVTCGA